MHFTLFIVTVQTHIYNYWLLHKMFYIDTYWRKSIWIQILSVSILVPFGIRSSILFLRINLMCSGDAIILRSILYKLRIYLSIIRVISIKGFALINIDGEKVWPRQFFVLIMMWSVEDMQLLAWSLMLFLSFRISCVISWVRYEGISCFILFLNYYRDFIGSECFMLLNIECWILQKPCSLSRLFVMLYTTRKKLKLKY